MASPSSFSFLDEEHRQGRRVLEMLPRTVGLVMQVINGITDVFSDVGVAVAFLDIGYVYFAWFAGFFVVANVIVSASLTARSTADAFVVLALLGIPYAAIELLLNPHVERTPNDVLSQRQFLELVAESLPQTFLQMSVLFVTTAELGAPVALQWVSFISSIVSAGNTLASRYQIANTSWNESTFSGVLLTVYAIAALVVRAGAFALAVVTTPLASLVSMLIVWILAVTVGVTLGGDRFFTAVWRYPLLYGAAPAPPEARSRPAIIGFSLMTVLEVVFIATAALGQSEYMLDRQPMFMVVVLLVLGSAFGLKMITAFFLFFLSVPFADLPTAFRLE